jgi:predicted RNA-binding Zn ribbon-like protein
MEPTDLIGLGDEPALEFVNTTADAGRGLNLELIGSGADYLDWLRRLDLITDSDRAAAETTFTAGELDDVAAEARELREWLRPVIADWSSDAQPQVPTDVLARMNEILELESRFARISVRPGETQVEDLRRWTDARQLLVPPIAAAARLLAVGDRGLVRNCEGCSMWFYDHTKAHRRRWCSMALCGNRAKARGHRERLAASKPTT